VVNVENKFIKPAIASNSDKHYYGPIVDIKKEFSLFAKYKNVTSELL